MICSLRAELCYSIKTSPSIKYYLKMEEALNCREASGCNTGVPVSDDASLSFESESNKREEVISNKFRRILIYF